MQYYTTGSANETVNEALDLKQTEIGNHIGSDVDSESAFDSIQCVVYVCVCLVYVRVNVCANLRLV